MSRGIRHGTNPPHPDAGRTPNVTATFALHTMAPFQNVPGRRLRPTLPYPLRFRFRLRFGSDTRARSGKVGRRRALFPTSHDHHPFDSQEERQAGRDRDSSRVPTPRAENVPCACHDPARGAADGQWSVIGGGPKRTRKMRVCVRVRAWREGGRRGRGEEGSPRGRPRHGLLRVVRPAGWECKTWRDKNGATTTYARTQFEGQQR